MISVITSSFNSASYLPVCLSSVLSQDLNDWEHIVVDCGSTDGSVDLLEEMKHPRLKVIRTDFCGVAEARNIGIEHAKGDLIAILDSDDVARWDRFSKQVSLFKKDINLVLTGSGMTRCNIASGKQRSYIYPTESDQLKFLLGVGCNPLPHSTLMFRRSAYNMVGGYRTIFEKCEDYDLVLRMSRIGGFSSIQESLVRYAERTDSHSHRHKPKGRDASFFTLLAIMVNSGCFVDRYGRSNTKTCVKIIEQLGHRGIYATLGILSAFAVSRNFGYLENISKYTLAKNAMRRLPTMLHLSACSEFWKLCFWQTTCEVIKAAEKELRNQIQLIK